MIQVDRLEKISRLWLWAVGLILLAVIGFVDYVTGFEIQLSPLYLVPISLVTWTVGKWAGLVLSTLGSLVALAAEIAAGQTYSNPAIFLWNTLIRLSTFMIVAWLLAELKTQLVYQKMLAQTDSLTGAVSTRFFYELVHIELERFNRYRHPFSVAYMDLDDFKAINDNFGHAIGDAVLCSVVEEARNHLRKVDVVARLGGDEFAFLFPETDAEGARTVIQLIHRRLEDQMRAKGWAVTFSVGVMTFMDAPSDQQDVIRIVDDLMYRVKKNGKNGIKYAVYPEQSVA